MSTGSSAAEEQLRLMVKEQLRKEWSVEDLQDLERLLRERSFSKWLRYQGRMLEMLQEQIWKARDREHYCFMQGQYDVARRFSPEQMLDDIKRIKEALSDERSS